MTTRQCTSEVERVFKKHDRHGDGRLRFSEFQDALSQAGVPRYMASIVFFQNEHDHHNDSNRSIERSRANDSNRNAERSRDNERLCDGWIDRQEFTAFHDSVQKPETPEVAKAASNLQDMVKQMVGANCFLHELTFSSPQATGSHLGAFFKDSNGGKFYVKFPGVPPAFDDLNGRRMFNEILANPKAFYTPESTDCRQSLAERIQAMSEVAVSKLYAMVGVEAACMRLVLIKGAEEDGPIGVWSRYMEYDDIGAHQMKGLEGLKEGFAADAWLANWDVIGTGKPQDLNMKRTKTGHAFRLDFGGCLQYRAQGGMKAETGTPFGADAVPETKTLRKQANGVFSDVSDSDIAAGVAQIVAGATDDAIKEVLQETLGGNSEDIADILIGRKNVLLKEFPPPVIGDHSPEKLQGAIGGYVNDQRRPQTPSMRQRIGGYMQLKMEAASNFFRGSQNKKRESHLQKSSTW